MDNTFFSGYEFDNEEEGENKEQNQNEVNHGQDELNDFITPSSYEVNPLDNPDMNNPINTGPLYNEQEDMTISDETEDSSESLNYEEDTENFNEINTQPELSQAEPIYDDRENNEISPDTLNNEVRIENGDPVNIEPEIKNEESRAENPKVKFDKQHQDPDKGWFSEFETFNSSNPNSGERDKVGLGDSLRFKGSDALFLKRKLRTRYSTLGSLKLDFSKKTFYKIYKTRPKSIGIVKIKRCPYCLRPIVNNVCEACGVSFCLLCGKLEDEDGCINSDCLNHKRDDEYFKNVNRKFGRCPFCGYELYYGFCNKCGIQTVCEYCEGDLEEGKCKNPACRDYSLDNEETELHCPECGEVVEKLNKECWSCGAELRFRV